MRKICQPIQRWCAPVCGGVILALLAHPLSAPAASISGGGVLIESAPPPEVKLDGKPISTKPISPYKPKDFQELPNARASLQKPLPEIPKVDTARQMTLPPPQPVKKLDEFGRLVQAAAEDFRSHQFEAAILKVNKAEALRPENPDLMNFRGAIYAESGNYSEAEALYHKALKIQPDRFWPWFNLAELQFMQKNYVDARKKFEEAMKQFPDNELLRFKIVLTYLMEKNEGSARSELERFKFPSDTASYYFAFASVEFVHGNVKAGQDWINSAVRIFGREGTDFHYQTLADLGWVPLPRP